MKKRKQSRRRNLSIRDLFQPLGMALYAPSKRKAFTMPVSTGHSRAGTGVAMFEGVAIKRTSDGDYVTALDQDSRFDTLSDAKRFIRAWRKRAVNPLPVGRFVKARVRRLRDGRIHLHILGGRKGRAA